MVHAVAIFESRAWCTSLSNGYLLQSQPMREILLALEKALVAGALCRVWCAVRQGVGVCALVCVHIFTV